jgi:WD40 repeat protein/uncharacterized caspase-like protein
MSPISRILVTALCFLFIASIALAQKPELIVEVAPPGMSGVEFSPDGKLVAISDHTGIKLWDIKTGHLVRELRTDVNFSFVDNGALFGEGPKLPEIISWNPNDLSTSVIGNTPRDMTFRTISFDRTTGVACAGDEDDLTRIWSLKTGMMIRSMKTRCDDVDLSSDGKLLLTADQDPDPRSVNETKTITIWDVASGRQLLLRKDAKGYAYSRDLERLAVRNASDGNIVILNARTGTEIRSFKNDKDFTVIRVSWDGKVLAAANAHMIRVWEVDSGAVRSNLENSGGTLAPILNLNRDGSLLGMLNGTVTIGNGYLRFAIYDTRTGEKLKGFEAMAEGPSSLDFSADGRMLASGTSGKTIKLWNLTSGEVLRTLSHGDNQVNSVLFSDDGRTLVSGSNFVKLWSLTSPRVFRLTGFNDVISVVALTHDGHTLAAKGGDANTIELYDADQANKVATLNGHSNIVTTLAVSPDDRTLISGSSDDTIRFWDLAARTQTKQITAGVGGLYSVAVSSDGRMVAAGGTSKLAKLWNLNSSLPVRKIVTHSEAVYGVEFSPNHKTLATLGNGIIELWDVNSGHTTGSFTGHMTRMAFSPDGRILATADQDSIKLRDSRTGDELASMIAVGDRDWLVVTPEGFFDGSPAAWNNILWRFSPRLYDVAPAEAFFNEFYYPDLLADVIAGKSPHATKAIAQRDRRQPHLDLTVSDESMAGSEVVTRFAKAKVTITDALAGARDVRLFRNGSLVKVWHGDVLKGQTATTLETSLPVSAGVNRLTAYAFNNDNIKSADATIEIKGGENLRRKGVAYLLAVGVNLYANAQYNLKFAVADAQDFASEFKRQQTALGNYERVETITLSDEQATKDQVLKVLQGLAAKSEPEDAVVIYFAGHGTAQRNQFFLIPHDLGYAGDRAQLDEKSLQEILAHSISDGELELALESVDAGQLLLVIDACNSGQALEAEEKRRGPMNSRGLAQLAYEKGMYILTAAQSYQAAQETARLGHGFLTYSLVEEGLKTKIADRAPTDGKVTLREWLDFATERVPAMQQEEIEQQRKQGRQLQQLTNFGVSAGELQRPRVFYRREVETTPFVVAKP